MNTAIHRRLEVLERRAAINPDDNRVDAIYVVGVERDSTTGALSEVGEPVVLWQRNKVANNDRRD